MTDCTASVNAVPNGAQAAPVVLSLPMSALGTGAPTASTKPGSTSVSPTPLSPTEGGDGEEICEIGGRGGRFAGDGNFPPPAGDSAPALFTPARYIPPAPPAHPGGSGVAP